MKSETETKPATEIWQVMTGEEVYQADLQTLKQWIGEGLVQPTDKVRKGALKWIEAQRAPVLRPVFTGEEQPPPATQPDEAAEFEARPADAFEPSHANAAQTHAREVEWPQALDLGGGAPSLSSSCRFHPAQAATLVCRECRATFCRACPNQVKASSVFLCPLCGGFCDPLERVAARANVYARQSEGFGLGDFRQALAYPFNHTSSLVGGAVLYGLLTLGGLRSQLLAWAFVFGCIALVIRRVGYGHTERDFMPDFSAFSFWDDVVVPFFLGVGITIVTVGPVILLVVALIFGWFGGGGQKPFALAPPSGAASRAITRDDMKTLANGGSAEQETELEQKVQAMTPRGQIAQGIKDSERQQEEGTALTVVRQLVARPGLIVLLTLAALGWAAFYYPMALLVAGWTEDFKSVVNPLVGLDTMRHMGATYFKAFLMYLAVEAASFAAGLFIALVTAPFQMPFVGNLPGKFLGGAVTFYGSLVVACLLGLALFKSADRLGIELD
jgi:hypothetical protein